MLAEHFGIYIIRLAYLNYSTFFTKPKRRQLRETMLQFILEVGGMAISIESRVSPFLDDIL
jgi:hypothetical protein